MATLERRIELLEQSADADAHRVCVVLGDGPVPAGTWAKVLRVEFVESPNTNRPVFEAEVGYAQS